jgi:hypothetical protein
MNLILPESIVIPEVAHRRKDNDFEDWLTASVIENTNQQDEHDHKSPGFTDLWLLEITQRTGKVWRGNFLVAFSTADGNESRSATGLEDGIAVISFLLNTDTGEMTFSSGTSGQGRVSQNAPEQARILVAAA